MHRAHCHLAIPQPLNDAVTHRIQRRVKKVETVV